MVTVTFIPQSARYIKIVQTGSAANWWSIHELNVRVGVPEPLRRSIELVGSPAHPLRRPTPAVPAIFLANALDGSQSTRWSTGIPESNGQWFQVDMGQINTIQRITIDAGASSADFPRGYQVLLSTNGSTFNEVASGTGSTSLITVNFTAQPARYIKMVQTGSSIYWWSIHELNAYP